MRLWSVSLPVGEAGSGTFIFSIGCCSVTRAFLALLLAVLVIAVAGCADGGDEAPTQPTEGASAVLCPKNVPPGDSFDANTLVGLTLAKARLEAAKYRCEVRPVSVDGRKLANVQDLRDDRVNVALVKGRIDSVVGVY